MSKLLYHPWHKQLLSQLHLLQGSRVASCLTAFPSLVSDTQLNSAPLQSLKPRNIFQLLLVQRLSVPNRPCLQHRSLKGGHVWQFSHPPTDSTDSLWLPFGIPPGSLSRRPGLHIAPILLSCQLCTRVSHSQECLTCACAEVEPESLTPALKKIKWRDFLRFAVMTRIHDRQTFTGAQHPAFSISIHTKHGGWSIYPPLYDFISWDVTAETVLKPFLVPL